MTTSGEGSGNGTISDAVGCIVGAIKENGEYRDRLLLELEILIEYFKNSEELSGFLERVLEGLAPKESEIDDWD